MTTCTLRRLSNTQRPCYIFTYGMSGVRSISNADILKYTEWLKTQDVNVTWGLAAAMIESNTDDDSWALAFKLMFI